METRKSCQASILSLSVRSYGKNKAIHNLDGLYGLVEILGNRRILGQGGGGFTHPRMILGWRRYLGIPGYLDKGGGGGGYIHPS